METYGLKYLKKTWFWSCSITIVGNCLEFSVGVIGEKGISLLLSGSFSNHATEQIIYRNYLKKKKKKYKKGMFITSCLPSHDIHHCNPCEASLATKQTLQGGVCVRCDASHMCQCVNGEVSWDTQGHICLSVRVSDTTHSLN